MKMANDTSYKKYTIQVIVNPGKFYVLEYGKEIQNETNSFVLQKDVQKFKQVEEISVGQIVAVKCEGRFYRGLITDIYNRCLKPKYYVWLVDNGRNVEVSADSIFILRNPELRIKKLNLLEVVADGIQPVTIELLVSSINLDNNLSRNDFTGILRKRVSDNWSPAAFKFIKDLFKTDKCIYVKCINTNGTTIIGDVYYKKEDDNVLISLAEILCDKDFAIFSKSASNIQTLDDYRCDVYVNSIEKRIPSVPQNLEWERLSITDRKMKFGSDNFSSCSGSDKSSSLGSDKFLNNSEHKASPSETGSFSPSWILKKMGNFSKSTSSESSKSSYQNIEQTEKAVPNPKISLLRIVQRNVQLYDKRK